jgi:hypothetical protein
MPTVDVELHAGERPTNPSPHLLIVMPRARLVGARMEIGEKSLQNDDGETCAEISSVNIPVFAR